MRSMISGFLGAHQDTTLSPRQSFCNYLYSEIKHLEEQDFLTFGNEPVKLLSGIQYKAGECKRQVTTTQQDTTFQLPKATQATAGPEYILMIPDTQQVSAPVVQPTQTAAPQPATVIANVQQPQRSASVSSQPASFIVVIEQQPGPSRQLMFALSPTKTFNPPSGTSGQQKDSEWNSSEVLEAYYTTSIFTLSTSTSTITNTNYHSIKTSKSSQPVQSADQAKSID